DDDDLVLAVATVQDRGPLPVGVQGNVDGEVAERHLLAGRLQRPAVGQEDRAAAGLHAGQRARGGCVLLGLRVVSETEGAPEGGQEREREQWSAHRDSPAGWMEYAA